MSSVVLVTIALGGRSRGRRTRTQTFTGRIMTADQAVPAPGEEPGAYIAAIRKQSQVELLRGQRRRTPGRSTSPAFLKTPLNDVEYVIKLYELDGRSQQLLASFDQFTDERGQQTILSNMTLDKKQVGVNKELLMTIESKGKVLASGRVQDPRRGRALHAARSTSPTTRRQEGRE